ncbi:hypothetical protein C8R44DRAFT_745445 [Mycena epipterygia]|nr:hypothetical protein C8R44DRAFT_745445 [Mycena epipterygia]
MAKKGHLLQFNAVAVTDGRKVETNIRTLGWLKGGGDYTVQKQTKKKVGARCGRQRQQQLTAGDSAAVMQKGAVTGSVGGGEETERDVCNGDALKLSLTLVVLTLSPAMASRGKWWKHTRLREGYSTTLAMTKVLNKDRPATRLMTAGEVSLAEKGWRTRFREGYSTTPAMTKVLNMDRPVWRPSVQRAASGALCTSELGAAATDKRHLSFAPALGRGKQRMDRTCTVKISGYTEPKKREGTYCQAPKDASGRCGVGGGLDLTLAVHEAAALERKGALGMKEHQGRYHTPCVRDHKSVEKLMTARGILSWRGMVGWGNTQMRGEYRYGEDDFHDLLREMSAYARLSHLTITPKLLGAFSSLQGTTWTGTGLLLENTGVQVDAAFTTDALTELHTANVKHADFVPRNVLRRDDGSFSVIDFGNAFVDHLCPGTDCGELKNLRDALEI